MQSAKGGVIGMPRPYAEAEFLPTDWLAGWPATWPAGCHLSRPLDSEAGKRTFSAQSSINQLDKPSKAPQKWPP